MHQPASLAGVVGALLVSGLSACASQPAAVPGPARDPEAIHYEFRVSPDLDRVDARVCFEGAPPRELSCGVAWGRSYLRGARTDAGDPLPRRDQRIVSAGLPRDGCLRYEVDVGAVAEERGGLQAQRRGGALLTNLALWLWRPARLSSSPRVTARFTLPEGMALSVPWPREGERYVLDDTAFRYLAYSVFGRFDREHIHASGVRAEVVVLDGLPEPAREAVVPWLTTALQVVGQPTGRFPRDRLQVLIIPAPPSGRPVGFGTVSRGGGASVAIHLPVNARLPELRGDWVAIHEFSHLFHPFIARRDAWLSEGLATYYQEVLRVRAGLVDEATAWRRLHEGAERGRAADRPLAEESADMYLTFDFPTVYWAGAAFALMADVELRRLTDGARTLDDVMGELAACCSSSPRPWTARRVVQRMDEIAGRPVFSRLVSRWVMGPRLPDLRATYAWLGLRVEGARVAEVPDAPGAAVRDAIMRPDPALRARLP
ncbi:MAG: hypothetical protein PVI30_02095 [Myxococcales bacterium]